MGKSLLFHGILHTQLSKYLFSAKANLDNYKGFTNPWEHIQNVKSIQEFVTQDSDVMCKVLSIIFYGSKQAWYHRFNLHFHDLSSKLIFYFSTSIQAKKAQWEDESIRVYIQRFNEEMFNMERLELIAIEVLINRVYNYYLWERLYTLPKQNLFSIKHAMGNYIKVKKASLTRQGHLYFQSLL